MNKSKQLVFFGSGPVGKATLEALLAAGFEIEAVITKARAPHHRGEMPVLDFALDKKIPVFTPADSDELARLFEANDFKSPIGVVVDYGIIISKEVIDYFEHGIVNSHFSLLPAWRGADPITFSILSGQTKTGVSLMLVNEGLDEGELLSQEPLAIPSAATTPELTENLIKLSNDMLARDLPKYLAGQLTPCPQANEESSYSRRLTKEEGLIDWGKAAEQLEREVRAYQGWPKSRAEVLGRQVIILKSRVAKNKDDGQLVMPATPGYLEILELKAPSGRTMSGSDFLRGYSRT